MLRWSVKQEVHLNSHKDAFCSRILPSSFFQGSLARRLMTVENFDGRWWRRTRTQDRWRTHIEKRPTSAIRFWNQHFLDLYSCCSTRTQVRSLRSWNLETAIEHQNDQTQKQFLSPSNPSHEHLKLNMENTTLLYNLFTTHTYFFSISNCTCQTSHIIVCIVYCVFAILYTIYLYIVLLLSVSCPVTVIVALWSFCHYSKFLVCVNIPGQ